MQDELRRRRAILNRMGVDGVGGGGLTDSDTDSDTDGDTDGDDDAKKSKEKKAEPNEPSM